MHTVELYRKVRLACRDGMSERAAARHFGISRESVKKMLCFSVPPGYRRTAPVRRPKLDEFTEIIDQCQRRLKIRPKGGAKDCHLGWWAELGVLFGAWVARRSAR